MRAKSFPHRRRSRGPFLWAVAAVATYLLYELAAALIEELPKLLRDLR